ncbi:MAG: hypothetical protein U1E15_12510 [Hyphomicrobiales bacterium]
MPPLTGLGTVKATSDWNAALASSAGWAFDDMMLYARAGAAFSNIDISSSLGGSRSDTRVGGLVGIGARVCTEQHLVSAAGSQPLWL